MTAVEQRIKATLASWPGNATQAATFLSLLRARGVLVEREERPREVTVHKTAALAGTTGILESVLNYPGVGMALRRVDGWIALRDAEVWVDQYGIRRNVEVFP